MERLLAEGRWLALCGSDERPKNRDEFLEFAAEEGLPRVRRQGHELWLRLDLQDGQGELRLGLCFDGGELVTWTSRPSDLFDDVIEQQKEEGGTAGTLLSELVEDLFDDAAVLVARQMERVEKMVEWDAESLEEADHPLWVLRRDNLELTRQIAVTSRLIGRFGRLCRDASPEVSAQLVAAAERGERLLEQLGLLRESTTDYMAYVQAKGDRKLNRSMQYLTVVSTVFIPLTFITGLYGMNFRFMPELNWPWSYPALLVFMALLAGWLIHLFRKKGWL